MLSPVALLEVPAEAAHETSKVLTLLVRNLLADELASLPPRQELVNAVVFGGVQPFAVGLRFHAPFIIEVMEAVARDRGMAGHKADG